MIWRNPVAWFGLATLLIPVLIHLLVRHRAEPRPFPSLRFVQPTRLASVRRKMISDWPLLLVRLAMLAAAVAALADPLWQSAARRAEWNARQTRAIVVDTTASVTGAGAAGASSSAALVDREVAGAIKADVIQTKQLADGIRRAAAWLRTAPPARRELVVISDFQLGALDAAILRDIPSHVGIRLVRVSGTPATRTVDGQARTQRAVASADARAGASAGGAANAVGNFTLRTPRVTLSANETAVAWVDAASPSAVAIETSDAAPTASDITLRPFDLTLRGSAKDREFLRAAAEAVLAQGVPLASGAGSGVPVSTDGAHRAATIIAGPAPNSDAASRAAGASTLTTQWQVDVARAIATDTSLARAVGRAVAGPPAIGSDIASAGSASATTSSVASNSGAAAQAFGEARSSATSSASSAAPRPVESAASVPPSEAAAQSRTASEASSDAPKASASAQVRSSTAASAAPGTAESGTPGPQSSEAAAKSRTASNASSDAPAPWIVLMRDAGGAPAILAAAEGGNGGTRMLVWSRLAAADEATALLIRATLRALAGADSFSEAEVIAIPDATLAQWQRPAAEPPVSEWRDVGGNDRRWLWGAVLALLIAEQVLRRRARHADGQSERKVLEHAA